MDNTNIKIKDKEALQKEILIELEAKLLLFEMMEQKLLKLELENNFNYSSVCYFIFNEKLKNLILLNRIKDEKK